MTGLPTDCPADSELVASRGDASRAISPSRKVAYVLLAVAGAAVVLFSTAAIARIMDWLPSPSSASDDSGAGDNFPGVNPDAGRGPGKLKCAECGAIVSIRQIDSDRTDVGVHAGRSANNAVRSANYYEITIRLRDGSKRVIAETNPAVWRVGERVSVIDSKTVVSR
jgi:hypothetical protein